MNGWIVGAIILFFLADTLLVVGAVIGGAMRERRERERDGGRA